MHADSHHNVLNFLETRFYSRHHEPEEEGLIVRLHPVHASLAEDSKVIEIAGDDLLAQSSEELLELERRAVDHMNDDHLDAIKLYAEVLLGEATGSWRLASLDMEGLDLVSGGYFTRLWFNPPLQEPSDIKKRLVELAILARD